MHIDVLQHVPFEGPAGITTWAKTRGIQLRIHRLDQGAPLPNVTDIDRLIVLGGPMSTTDPLPWLEPERSLIRETLAAGRPILGICLGAQQIAAALGAKVYPHSVKEIGWFPVAKQTPNNTNILASLPDRFDAFHWHGDTFDLPTGATSLAASDHCTNQAFCVGTATALQFHLESTRESVQLLVDNCKNELIDIPYVQTAQQMLHPNAPFQALEDNLSRALDAWASGYQ